MLDDLQAEYEQLKQELVRLQDERARLDAQRPLNRQKEREYALELGRYHARVVAYLARLEQLQSAEPEEQG